jgi:hypothetical protein
MEQVFEGLGMTVVQEGACRVRSGGLLLEASQSLAGEGVQRVADGGGGTAKVACDVGGCFAAGAGEEDLTATDGEGVGRTQALLEPLLLSSVQGRNKKSWFHTPLFAPSCR